LPNCELYKTTENSTSPDPTQNPTEIAKLNKNIDNMDDKINDKDDKIVLIILSVYLTTSAFKKPPKLCKITILITVEFQP